MKIVTSWETLMHRAADVGAARRSGNAEELAKAQERLKDYEQTVLESDEVILPVYVGGI